MSRPERLYTGTVSELIASAHLVSLKYEVFQTINPLGPCDLVIRTEGGEVFFVEVKTANKGHLVNPAKLNSDVADILALVDIPSHQVRYKGLDTKMWGMTPLRLSSHTMPPFSS